MRPCECKDIQDVMSMDAAGIGFNEWSIEVRPASVIIRNSTTEILIPMHYFGRFAVWYLRDSPKDKS